MQNIYAHETHTKIYTHTNHTAKILHKKDNTCLTHPPVICFSVFWVLFIIQYSIKLYHSYLDNSPCYNIKRHFVKNLLHSIC